MSSDSPSEKRIYLQKKPLAESYQSLKSKNELLNFFATRDSLTSTYNRRYLFDYIEKLEADPDVTSATAIMIDVDKMKAINDSLIPNPNLENKWGHAAGDVLLRKVAQVAQFSVRDEDVVARFGGDEFVIILPEVGRPEDVKGFAERLSENFKNANLKVSLGHDTAFRVGSNLDLKQAVINADGGMYARKNEKKNKKH